MIIEVDGMEIVLVEDDDRQCFHIKCGRGYEKESLITWAQMVRPGEVALDVGAYTGLYSIIAAKRGAAAIAMEPMPANHWRLGVNVAANKVVVMLMDVAASDTNNRVWLHFNPRVPLTTGASLEVGVQQHTESIEVGCVTIDALALSKVGAIKIDVERHEPCVLRGAANTIERDRPALLIECLDMDMRVKVLHALPSYSVASILDGRNTLFIPK